MKIQYNQQTALLLKVLPVVAEETCFALHGGTAINLFYENLPRLSVDIDLTYVIIEDRVTSVKKINDALQRIMAKLFLLLPSPQIAFLESLSKLIITSENVTIKIEVNLTKRGILYPSKIMTLCENARTLYQTNYEMSVVDKGLLYGGKICAALDRQHPRDLFDITLFFENSGITQDIKEGLLLYLFSADRPIHEIVSPSLLDMQETMEKSFEGMTDRPFTYNEFLLTRTLLIESVYNALSEDDKSFIIDFEAGTLDWNLYNFSEFPGVRWKLQNIIKLSTNNPIKHKQLLEELKRKLFRTK